MDEILRTAAISPLRQHMIDDMNMRRFTRDTARLHPGRGTVRHVPGALARHGDGG